MPMIRYTQIFPVIGFAFLLGCSPPQTTPKYFWHYDGGEEDLRQLYLFPHNSLEGVSTFNNEELKYSEFVKTPDWKNFKSLYREGDELWHWYGGGHLVKPTAKEFPSGGSPFGACLIRKGKIISIYVMGIISVS